MNEYKDTLADPWLKKAGKTASLPADVLFACAYKLNIGPDIIEEASFFRRIETTDELWIVAGSALPSIRGITAENASLQDVERSANFGIWCAFAVPKKNEKLSACLNLLDHFFHARVGFYWPGTFVAAGIVDELAFKTLVGRIERELEENTEKARQRETEIIKAARELGLSPQPTGTGPYFWQARCPGTNHPLYINAAENSFGCGWCKRKGAVEELRAFVKESKGRRTNS
jgi:hypothetical protein